MTLQLFQALLKYANMRPVERPLASQFFDELGFYQNELVIEKGSERILERDERDSPFAIYDPGTFSGVVLPPLDRPILFRVWHMTLCKYFLSTNRSSFAPIEPHHVVRLPKMRLGDRLQDFLVTPGILDGAAVRKVA